MKAVAAHALGIELSVWRNDRPPIVPAVEGRVEARNLRQLRKPRSRIGADWREIVRLVKWRERSVALEIASSI